MNSSARSTIASGLSPASPPARARAGRRAGDPPCRFVSVTAPLPPATRRRTLRYAMVNAVDNGDGTGVPWHPSGEGSHMGTALTSSAARPGAEDLVRPHTAAPAPSSAVGMTVGRVLQVAALRCADPEVVGGVAGLDRAVRWVHTTELSDVAALLRGGDLLLSTGIALSDAPGELTAFAESLDRSDAAGLVIELGRRWSELPPALVQACDRLGLPLIALHREVRFAEVGQAVGELIVD